MDSKISALITDLEATRSRLNAALEQIAPQAEIYPSWQVKQLLDHITGWDELVCDILRANQSGESLPQTARNINQFNARSVSNRESISLEQSRRDYERVRSDELNLLQEMPEELFTKKFTAPWGGEWTIARMLKLFIGHEREHAEQVEKLIPSTSTAR